MKKVYLKADVAGETNALKLATPPLATDLYFILVRIFNVMTFQKRKMNHFQEKIKFRLLKLIEHVAIGVFDLE